MKKTITRTFFATLFLLLGFTLSSSAQTYYDVYLCGNATAKLHMPEESSLVSGDKVHWFINGTAAAGTPITFSGTAGSTDLLVPESVLAAGLNNITTIIESKDGCMGIVSDPFTIYKLPTKTLALTKSVASYCAENSAATSGSVVTATTTPAIATLPAGIEYAYTWSVTSGGSAVTPGTADGSKTETSAYTMTTTAAGSYVFNAKVKYVRAAGNTGVLISGDADGCEVAATATETVVVTPRPGRPRIQLAP